MQAAITHVEIDRNRLPDLVLGSEGRIQRYLCGHIDPYLLVLPLVDRRLPAYDGADGMVGYFDRSDLPYLSSITLFPC